MDIVTGLETQRGKMRMIINEDTTILVPMSLFRERPFQVGDPIDMDDYDHWLMLRQYRHALDRAVVFLTARARSKKEVERKLLQCGYLPSTVEMVLLKLETMNILNDADFAAQWVEARGDKLLGKRRIQQELRQKGISQEEADAAISSLDDDSQQEQANRLAAKLASRYAKDEPRKAAQKLMQALVRRGFDWETAKQATSNALNSSFEDE